MESQNFSSQYQPGQEIRAGQAEERRRLEGRFKGGANWFFWVAALSIINSVIVVAGGQWGFIFGLGATQIVDGISMAVAEEAGTGAQFFGLGVSMVIAGFVVLFGVLARKRMQGAFILGMVLYALDGLIVLLAGDWLSAAFHGWVLFGLFTGLRACRQLNEIDAPTMGMRNVA